MPEFLEAKISIYNEVPFKNYFKACDSDHLESLLVDMGVGGIGFTITYFKRELKRLQSHGIPPPTPGLGISEQKLNAFVNLQLQVDFYLEHGQKCNMCTRYLFWLMICANSAHERIEYIEDELEEGTISEGEYLKKSNFLKELHEVQESLSIFNCPIVVKGHVVRIYLMKDDESFKCIKLLLTLGFIRPTA